MKNLWWGVGLILLGGGIYFGYQIMYPKPMTKTTKEKAESATPKSYNMSQVAEHASKDSCWLVLDSKVYDVTPFVTSGFHPGKDAILEGCGKDATELFNTRPMGSGTSHSDKARGMLGKYYIGDISET